MSSEPCKEIICGDEQSESKNSWIIPFIFNKLNIYLQSLKISANTTE